MRNWLSDVTVLDFTGNVAGPFATLVLGAMGARVIKIERPPHGDPVRGWPPFENGLSAPFYALNRGKQSIAVDLREPAEREAVLRMAHRCDVLVESWKPGTAARHGFGYNELRQVNPGLVYCSVSAFGGVGPMGDLPGYDAIIQAYSGVMALTGEADGPPVRTGTGFIDYGAGMWAALGIIGALLSRARTGQGCEVMASLLGAAATFEMHHLASVMMGGAVPGRQGTAQHNTAPYEAIRTPTGDVMLGVSTPAVWEKLLDAMDDGRLRANPRFAANADRVANRRELVRELEALASTSSAEELVERLMAKGVPASVIRTVGDLPGDPQLRALGLVLEEGGRLGLGGLPLMVDRAGDRDLGSVPAVGQDTAAVLAEFDVNRVG